MGALAPENASVVMFDGRIDVGSSWSVEVTMWPSAPHSIIDGVTLRVETFVKSLLCRSTNFNDRRGLSGGFGGG